jgi:PAS domain S-box-containing protein
MTTALSWPEPSIDRSPLRPVPDIAIAIFWTNTAGEVTTWDTSAERLLGWSADDAVGHPPPFIGEQSADLWRQVCHCVSLGASVRNAELKAITTGGTCVHVTVSSGPGRRDVDTVVAIVHIVSVKAQNRRS